MAKQLQPPNSPQERRLWKTVAENPTEWRRSAEMLKMSADVLWRHFDRRIPKRSREWLETRDVIPACFLLMGYAIENLAKAIVVARGQKPPPIHGTRKILADEKIWVGKNEADLLETLEDYVVWWGKYPVPKYDSEYTYMHLLSVPLHKRPVAVKLYNRLLKRLDRMHPQPKPRRHSA